MLFGLALIYGTTGEAYLVELLAGLPVYASQPAFNLGLLMVLCGFFFKLAIFPFHIWAPDVYEGAAHPVAAYIATVSKVAAIGILVRMAALGGTAYFVDVLAVLAITSMTVGNLAALAQKDFKRLLAYSSVAHGRVLADRCFEHRGSRVCRGDFLCAGRARNEIHLFHGGGQRGGGDTNPTVADLAGLHRRAPLMAMALMMALFGLAGIPPTIGFTGKLLIFTAAMSQGHFTLVLIAMVNVVISLYYYLMVLRAAYLLEPADDSPRFPGNIAAKGPLPGHDRGHRGAGPLPPSSHRIDATGGRPALLSG